MKTRMERYFNEEEEIVRSKKNQDLYQDIYNNLPSSNVAVLSNENEIDISKIKELIQSREGYKRVREYQTVLKTPSVDEEKEEYDIYEDMDNKIYDINMILEDAKLKRNTPERERYRSLRNTQYDILTKLDLNDANNPDQDDEMVTDFFTQDTTVKDLVTSLHAELKGNDEKTITRTKTSVDLFADLKGNENTILTEAITEEKVRTVKKDSEEESFYTNHMSFTKEDFEGFQNLQSTVRKNNNLIKALIAILTVIILAVIAFVIFTMI